MTALSPHRTYGSSAPPKPDEPGHQARTITDRRSVPSSRAVAGGLLVAAATVGIFAAYRSASAAPTTSFVVAAADLPIGTPLTESVLDVAAIDLPGAVAARVYTDPAELVGQVTVAPLARGDLVQASSVVEAGASAAGHELSFGLDTDRVVNGRLDAGERVDVLVTYGSGADAYTEAVVRGVRVVEISQGDSGTLTASGRTVLTLALPQAADALAVTHAVRAGEVTIVRTTFADAAAPAPDRYRPAAPGDPPLEAPVSVDGGGGGEGGPG